MKLHRTFIAINLPESVKERLLKYQHAWAELPARWVDKDNLHLTLAFLGNRADEELAEISQLMVAIGERHNPFLIEFTRITYGPSRSTPKMIWVIGEKSSELSLIQTDVETTLAHHDDPSTTLRAGKPFSPHLTLARLNMTAFRRIEADEIPEIAEDISISFEVQSIEVMESELKRHGPQYTICQSILLQEQ